MFEPRSEEQNYAKLYDPVTEQENRYGQKIDLIELTGLPKDRSMFINEEEFVGDNPNRNKQHGFHFTADNCIGCHACEAACSEKNDLPAHISFRSVGYVEGGTYPDFKRMNISMACNHCDDPVCLKGCPTRAYTKHAEYGAVLQDPDICFGCGYCTWVCPYNAPQLDPVKGQVSKCNMCVDRLEVGLKPACVSACLGNALNFGVIENTPENREQTKTEIPGFPTTDITHPNIRFQQMKGMPKEVTRTDGMPIKYQIDETSGGYVPKVDEKKGKEKFWSLDRLSSRENPLVIFTLAAQGVIGAFLLMFLGTQFDIAPIQALTSSSAYLPLLATLIVVLMAGLVLSTMHLGKPHRFYRAFNNLRYSPVSREIGGVAIFTTGFMGYTFFNLFENEFVNNLFTSETSSGLTGFVASIVGDWFTQVIPQGFGSAFGWLAAVGGPLALYFMHAIYRIKARPFWNHWQVLTAFYGSMLSIGAIFAGLFFIPYLLITSQAYGLVLQILAGMLALGLAIEGIGHYFHARNLNTVINEGTASHYIQSTTFGKTYIARNLALAANMLIAAGLLLTGGESVISLVIAGLLIVSVAVSALAGRALFYVLVVPTTMPGAFFWKNKDFEEHARDIGLANMPQVGVIADAH